ncbi:MAG: 30S ribosomal protein S18 [Candidatus Omnitrophica bacterium]|nr:30S ribosomal protein S18 [Candidatus Omnitrophota bacterium]MDD5352867.1 30S ribosomal protein S18 [Candidatus Omnitrophota bacterium]MDD5550466.1 30S ribosomal protein S18 [Candidatus Omnitrophota bacterium]
MRKKYCRFCKDKVKDIDYKNLNVLEKLISERGKILSRRNTGTCARHQRIIAAVIKRARFLSLMPYTRYI